MPTWFRPTSRPPRPPTRPHGAGALPIADLGSAGSRRGTSEHAGEFDTTASRTSWSARRPRPGPSRRGRGGLPFATAVKKYSGQRVGPQGRAIGCYSPASPVWSRSPAVRGQSRPAGSIVVHRPAGQRLLRTCPDQADAERVRDRSRRRRAPRRATQHAARPSSSRLDPAHAAHGRSPRDRHVGPDDLERRRPPSRAHRRRRRASSTQPRTRRQLVVPSVVAVGLGPARRRALGATRGDGSTQRDGEASHAAPPRGRRVPRRRELRRALRARTGLRRRSTPGSPTSSSRSPPRCPLAPSSTPCRARRSSPSEPSRCSGRVTTWRCRSWSRRSASSTSPARRSASTRWPSGFGSATRSRLPERLRRTGPGAPRPDALGRGARRRRLRVETATRADPEVRAVVLHHLGLPTSASWMPLAALGDFRCADHLTSVYLPRPADRRRRGRRPRRR